MITLLRKRRSIRHFQARPLEPEKISLLEEALLRSPSSRDRQPCRFIFVTDPRLLNSLSEGKAHGAEFLARAPLAVVFVADETVSDVWLEDAALAAGVLQLTAESLGLGSCWVQFRLRQRIDGILSEDYLRELLGCRPEERIPLALGIGYPAETPQPVPEGKLRRVKITRL